MKKILKILGVIIFIIIPAILIICNMFFDFFGYIIIVNEKNKEEVNEIIKEEGIEITNSKIIIVNTKTGDDDVKFITDEGVVSDLKIKSESKLITYIEKNGIDIYYTITKINYIYIIVVAIVIFFKKLLENVDMFGKFEEKDN